MNGRCSVDGTVQHVIFQNEENGYTVLRLVTSDGEAVTVVGTIPCAAPGENLIVTGQWVSHPVHGEQVQASQVERHMPATEDEILDYLSSGIIKGVGPATADRLVQRFGVNTLRVMEEEPELLAKVKGITPRKASEIGESYRYQTGMRRLLEFLSRNDLPLALALRLYRRYGAGALEAVKENPYLLVEEVYGVDFSVMDEIALSMGMAGDSRRRVEAASSAVRRTWWRRLWTTSSPGAASAASRWRRWTPAISAGSGRRRSTWRRSWSGCSGARRTGRTTYPIRRTGSSPKLRRPRASPTPPPRGEPWSWRRGRGWCC